MEIYEKVLTKSEINSRFVTAVDAVLMNGLISSKGGLAESLKVKPAKFSEILNGRMNVGADMLAIMCNSYQVSPEWLLMSRGKRVFRTTMLPATFIDEQDINMEYPKDIFWETEAEKTEKQQPQADIAPFLHLIHEKDKEIKEQAEEIGQLKERIRQLESERGANDSDADSETVARAV